MSFIQFYNEKIYDVLDPSGNENIRFSEFPDLFPLNGVTEWPVECIEDVTKQLRRNPNRVREAGRSHTVFTLIYHEESVSIDGITGEKVSKTIDGKIDFVDLVGVERTTKHSTNDSSSTGNTATAKANKSLKTFHQVVADLIDRENKCNH